MTDAEVMASLRGHIERYGEDGASLTYEDGQPVIHIEDRKKIVHWFAGTGSTHCGFPTPDGSCT
jgi:hypothetical protein